jgi:cytochrome c biogenesis protein CcmG/thiol:disulfide interchange protein DsbE
MRFIAAIGLAVASVWTGLASASTPALDPLDLAALHGKVVYIDFWASWCVPCRQSFPWMDGLGRELEREGLVIVAVNVDHERADAERFLRQFAPQFRIAYDPEGALAERYQVRGMPTSVLLDRAGRTVFVHQGFRDRERESLEKQIRAALAAR